MLDDSRQLKNTQSNRIAYVALVVSLISLGLSGWMFYSAYEAKESKPKTTEEKIDQFFDQQDKEFDKMFEERGEVNE